jgi:heme-degrading monooxygenase HmoA
MEIGQPFTCGTWIVSPGNEDEFIERWTEFVGWSHANAGGAQRFWLIRDIAEPSHFLSFGEWGSKEDVDGWRATDEFQQLIGRCRELCADFRGTDHTLAAAVGA